MRLLDLLGKTSGKNEDLWQCKSSRRSRERFHLNSTPVKKQGNLSPGNWLKVALRLKSSGSEWARSRFTHWPRNQHADLAEAASRERNAHQLTALSAGTAPQLTK